MTEQLKTASLKPESVQKVREPEDDLDVHVMAFDRGRELADLDDIQIRRVRQLEDDMDVTLLVYRSRGGQAVGSSALIDRWVY